MHVVTILVFMMVIPLALLGLVYIYEALWPIIKKSFLASNYSKLVPYQYPQKTFLGLQFRSSCKVELRRVGEGILPHKC